METICVYKVSVEIKSPAALDAHLGYWLRLVSNHVSTAFAEKLAAREIGVAEWVMLRILFEGPRSPSDLAELMGVTRGGVTKIAERLAVRGLIDRQRDEIDRRGQSLAITREGRMLTPRLAALADKNEAEFFDTLKPSERAALEKILRTLAVRHGWHASPIE